MSHSDGCNFGCDIGKLGQVIIWPTQVGAVVGAILVNLWRVFMWPIQMGVIVGAIFMNRMGYLSGPLKWVGLCTQYG